MLIGAPARAFSEQPSDRRVAQDVGKTPRQYLLLHTGNRIDAVLGNRVFEHLLRLPLRYFEQRPTGTLVARLQGVETIREFLTGAAASLALDLPFALIFLAMWIRYTVPRFRYDQLMRFGWKILVPAAIVNIIITSTVILFLA